MEPLFLPFRNMIYTCLKYQDECPLILKKNEGQESKAASIWVGTSRKVGGIRRG
jgi:hypothetical protein